MKKYLMTGIAALTLCAGFTSCSHDDFEPMTQAQIDKAKYDMAFLNYVGGKIAANQDWGFGATRALTRAAATWDGNHTCAVEDWNAVLGFEVPSNAVDLTKGSFTDAEKSASEFVIPESHNGDLNFNYAFNIPAGAKIYNLGKTTSFTGANYDGLVTFYNVNDAEFRFVHATATRHTFVNIGTLTLVDYAHVGEVYNGGDLVLEGEEQTVYEWNAEKNANDIYTVTKADVPNEMKIYSNGTGKIMADCDVDLKSVCDIHGTLDVTGNLKIQNGSTSKYICGIKATGTVENVDGPFYTSYVEADKFTVDGNETYLLAGGHIKANTVHVYNSGCSIKAAAGSTALIEAKDFIFANDNDFERTVSDNVYFQISGSVDVSGVTNGTLNERKKFDNAEAYIAANGNPNDKLNAGTATGSPACGEAWTVGTPDNTGDDDDDDDNNTEETDGYGLRIIAEDLSAQEAGDFDFNDVVFDVKFDATNAKIKILAAGGTLPLRIAGKYEVHAALGAGENEMVNTNAKGGVEKNPVEIELGYGVADAADAKKITIEVFKNGEWQELTAEKGEPAAKLAVGTDFQWLNERQSIKDAYEKFVDWVDGTGFTSEWWK